MRPVPYDVMRCTEGDWGYVFWGSHTQGCNGISRGLTSADSLVGPSGWVNGGIRGGFCWASMDNGAVVSRVQWRVSGVIGGVQGHDWGARASTLETTKWMPCLFLKHVKEWSSLVSAVPSDRQKSTKNRAVNGVINSSQMLCSEVEWFQRFPQIFNHHSRHWMREEDMNYPVMKQILRCQCPSQVWSFLNF